MKNKIVVLLVVSAVFGMLAAPIGFASDTTVTGTFTATASLDVDVNRSTAAFGTITVSDHFTVPFKLVNNGTVAADVTQDQAVKDSGDMTIGTNGSLAQDEYSVVMNVSEVWTDIGQNDNTEIADGLAASGEKGYNITVYIGPSLSAESHADEQFSIDVTVAADT